MEVNLWSEIGEIFNDLLAGVLAWVDAVIFAHAPAFLSGLLILLLGWVLAAFLRRFASRLLRALGFDVVAERSGLRTYLRERDVAVAPSAMVGWLVYFVILYTALKMALQRAEMTAASRLLADVAAFLPRLVVVLVLLALGFFLGRWIGSIVSRAARLADAPFPDLLGSMTRVGVILLTVLAVLDYLGLASMPILLAGLGVLVGAGVLVTVLLVVCARDLAGDVLARKFVVREYLPGDEVTIGEVSGVVDSVGATMLRLRTDEGDILVPHHTVAGEIVRRRRFDSSPAQ